MPNKMPAVDAVLKEQRKGWPKGTESVYTYLPDLFARIRELEDALAPFGKVGSLEAHSDRPLVHVYLKDCVHAWQMLDPAQGTLPPRETFFDLPAEG